MTQVGHICNSHRSQDHVIQKKLEKVLKQMILYSITIVYWSYKEYIDLRVD